MTRRELDTLGCVIEWAVSPRPPLPALADTDAVTAFASNFERGSRPERVALRGLLAALELLPFLAGERRRLTSLPPHRRAGVLGRLERGPAAPVGSALAALAQFSYYGDLGVMRQLGYDPERVRARGRAVRATEGRW